MLPQLIGFELNAADTVPFPFPVLTTVNEYIARPGDTVAEIIVLLLVVSGSDGSCQARDTGEREVQWRLNCAVAIFP